MASKALPSPEVLRQLLRYEPETGKLFWLPRGAEWFGGTRDLGYSSRAWNAARAGKEAMTNVSSRGYKTGRIFRACVKAHRVAWAVHYGEWPKGEIDHINRDKGDNRIENLRDVTGAVNSKNQPMLPSNKSGKTGVCWSPAIGKWHANIRSDGVRHHLGFFADIADAISAREAAEKRFGFHPNHGRAA